MQGDNLWAATTAGCSRYNTVTGEWTIFTRRTPPMEEIWQLWCPPTTAKDKVYLAGLGQRLPGVRLKKADRKRGDPWKCWYLDPDGEMEIDLYRDDGIVHVIRDRR